MTTAATRTIALTDRELGELELLLAGAFAPLTSYPGPADLAAIRSGGTLADGTPAPAALTLPIPAETAAGDRLELLDPEGAPVAALPVTETVTDAGHTHATGPIEPLRPAAYGPFRSLRRTPKQVRAELGERPVLAHVAAEPLLTAELTALQAQRDGAALLVLAAIGDTGATIGPTALVPTLLAALPDDALVVPVPLSDLSDPVRAQVAGNYGATRIAALPQIDRAGLLAALDAGTDIPETLAPAAVTAVLRRARRPLDERGVVVFFTGFSGSGKSTVARGLYDRIVESGTRPVTLLDGDVVRTLLSKGLGFSRADRDLNINRIGFVAAEIARAGGMAICAPIAPYAATRAEVRRRVTAAGDFVLIHVATPLEVCEARDRKGLYAKARAGIIPEFTGISDPYEVPDDADLRLDTSTMSEADSVEAVLTLLVERGYLKE
ncbi:MAG TPA: adenylyl-sulfate kinase [Mycobacteriales bacterium]|nr:adenylyl-sulfate kinase [Mycobacteriales bacterium]